MNVLPNKRLTVLPLRRAVRFAIVLLAAGASASALADPPGRVARLAYAAGPVSFAPAGQDDWLQASLNRPLISGDRLWADAGGRDELQVGSASVRMDGGTLLSVVNVDDRAVQLQLNQGRLDVRVRELAPDGVFEIDTPNLALNLRRPGDYRIDVDPNGNVTSVAVRNGQAEADGDGAAYTIEAGQAYRFGGTDLRNNAPLAMAPDDDFDRWAEERDRRQDQSVSARYVPRELTGYDDLDDNGSWSTVEGYGNVWTPTRVSADWVPYQDGHWTWIEPWGWTWVDDAPWGFAVSHYGRWAHFGSRWGWVPGPVAVRPVYAPALVVFVGGFSGPRENVAWFPLGPREVYRPGYHVSQNYFNNINISNARIDRMQVTNVYNNRGGNISYVNRQVNGAVVAVPMAAFAGARPVRGAAVRLAPHALDRAPVLQGAGVTPQRISVSGAAGPGRRPGAAIQNRPVIARTAPPSQARAFAAGAPGAAWQAPQGAGQHRPFQQIRTVTPGGPPRPIASAPHGAPLAQQQRPGQPQQGQVPQPAQPGQARPGMQQPGQPGQVRPGAPQQAQLPQPGQQRPGMPPQGQQPHPGQQPAQQAQQLPHPGVPQAQAQQPGHGLPQQQANPAQARQNEERRDERRQPGQPAQPAPQAQAQARPQPENHAQPREAAPRPPQHEQAQQNHPQPQQPRPPQMAESRPQPHFQPPQHNEAPPQQREQHEQHMAPQPHPQSQPHGEAHPAGGGGGHGEEKK